VALLDDLPKLLKMALLPEEEGEIGRYRIDHADQFIGAVFRGHELVVVGEGPEIAFTQALPQTRLDELLLSVMQIDPALPINEPADLFEIDVSHFQTVHRRTPLRGYPGRSVFNRLSRDLPSPRTSLQIRVSSHASPGPKAGGEGALPARKNTTRVFR